MFLRFVIYSIALHLILLLLLVFYEPPMKPQEYHVSLQLVNIKQQVVLKNKSTQNTQKTVDTTKLQVKRDKKAIVHELLKNLTNNESATKGVNKPNTSKTKEGNAKNADQQSISRNKSSASSTKQQVKEQSNQLSPQETTANDSAVNTDSSTKRSSTKHLEQQPASLKNEQSNDGHQLSKHQAQQSIDKSVKVKKDHDFLNWLDQDVEKQELQQKNQAQELDNLSLSASNKQSIKNNLLSCIAFLYELRDQQDSIILHITLNQQAFIDKVVILDHQGNEIPSDQLSVLQKKVLTVLNSGHCNAFKLDSKNYEQWNEFTIHLNMQNFITN